MPGISRPKRAAPWLAMVLVAVAVLTTSPGSGNGTVVAAPGGPVRSSPDRQPSPSQCTWNDDTLALASCILGLLDAAATVSGYRDAASPLEIQVVTPGESYVCLGEQMVGGEHGSLTVAWCYDRGVLAIDDTTFRDEAHRVLRNLHMKLAFWYAVRLQNPIAEPDDTKAACWAGDLVRTMVTQGVISREDAQAMISVTALTLLGGSFIRGFEGGKRAC